jgi:processing peptidase subunit beta
MLSTALRFQLQRRLGARGVSQVLAEPTAWNQPAAVVTTLPNGLKVATKQTFGDLSSVGVFIDAGTRDESPGTAGATHMLSKLALTGTAKRPKGKLDLELDSMGAELSVEAGRETTSYMMSVPGSDLSKSVEILADLLAKPTANFAKEKDAILRSLDESDLSTRAVIEDRLHSCAFRDCSLGFPTTGPFDGVASISEATLSSFAAANFTAEKMVVAAVGPLKHEDVVKLATASLGSLKAGAPKMAEGKPYFTGAELIYRNDEMGPTAYISVGWEGVPLKSQDAVTMMVMKQIIGSYTKGAGLVPGNISGNRTVNHIANKMGVGCADEFEAFSLNYKDTGVFGFYAACDEVAVEHCIGELMFGANMLSHSVTDEEVARGKRELKAAISGGCATTSAACSELGAQMLAYGRSVPIAEMMLRIDAVDAEEVKRVAWKYLNDGEISVTALGPLHGIPQYYDLRRMTNMHRY